MKPLFLRMTAFGPFSETVDISFDRVFDGGLFLIHGRTGAGKTSILDGLCFSLFGRPSSEEREKDLSTIRSDLAAASLMTECELVFAIGNSAYRVHRIPTQDKPKKRGDGFTEHKGSAELYRFNGTLSELRASLADGDIAGLEWQPLAGKLEAVNGAVESLIGMNERQFRQVIVLPQGRFREFLSSSSTERQAILEKLFQTDRFSRFQSSLAAKSRALESNLKEALQSFSTKLASRGLTTLEEVEPKLIEQKSLLENSRHSLTLRRNDVDRLDRELNRAIEFAKANARKVELENQAAALDLQKEDIESNRREVTRHRAWMPFFETSSSLERLTTKTAALETSKGELEKTQRMLAERKSVLHKQEMTERELRPTLDEIANERVRLRESALKLREIESLRKDAVLGQSQIAQLTTDVSKLVAQKLTAFEQCRRIFNELVTLDTSLSATEEKLIVSEELRISSLELQYHQNEVVKISEKLQKDAPCPVCGSKDHPSPAHLVNASQSKTTPSTIHSDVLTAEAIADQRVKFDQTKLQHTEQRSLRKSRLEPLAEIFGDSRQTMPPEPSAVARTHESFDAVFKKISAKRLELNAFDTALESKTVELHTRTETSEQLTRTIERKLSELPANERIIEQVMTHGLELKSEQERREKRLGELAGEISRSEAELSHTSGKLSALTDELQRTNSEAKLLAAKKADLEVAALNKLRSLGSESLPPEKQLSEDELAKLENHIQHFDSMRSRIAAATNEVAATLKGMNSPGKQESIEGELIEARRQRTELESSVARLTVDIEALEKLLDESRTEKKRLEGLQNDAEQAARISALLSGDRSQNKLLVPLSRFVLQSRFEDVLDQANRRLSMMSRGQFQLRRPALSGNLRDSQGLELTVEDAIAGKERHTGSLSGGESFMAALALALGLADVVQSDLGGLRLDSVLIDEGFGTLDSESLDLALKTLIDLQSGGRFVGIISHVQELKNQVPVQLEVIKTPAGSRVRWNESLDRATSSVNHQQTAGATLASAPF